MTAPATARALERLARPVRATARIGWLATGLGCAALVLGVAAWLARLGLVTAPWWVLVAWGCAAAGVAAVLVAGWRGDGSLGLRAFARRLEELGGWRSGALSALLDPPADGTSAALLHFADRAQADDLARRGGDVAAPIARRATGRLLVGAGCLAAGVGTLAAAGPVRGMAASLWHPRRAWLATVAPVRLRAETSEVERGGRVGLVVEAAGRRDATLWLRAPGEAWRATPLALDSAGRGRYVAGPLESDLFARVTSGNRASDTVAVKVRLPVFVGAVTVTAHYPAYLKLDAETVPTSGDTILLPAGTRLETRGEATAPLATAAWIAKGAAESLAVAQSRFSGSFTPRASGTWRLALSTVSGRPLAGDSLLLPVHIVPDSAPTVEIPVPGADTSAPLGLQVPLVIDVRDDHGIRAVQIETRRVAALGGAGAVQRETVPLPAGLADRGILSFTLDLNRRGLLPGDTLRYAAVATDNSPQAQRGRSREFVLRLPTMSEVRAAQRQSTRGVAGQIDSLAAASKRLERATEDLAREQPRAGSRDGARPDALPYDEAKRAEQVAADQQQLLRQAEQLKQAIEQLQKSAEAAGIRDTAWQKQLAEIRQQLDRALTPELRQKLEALQRSLKDLNAEDTKRALEDLAERQRQLREALEQSKELFRRAAVEGDLANLTQESRDLVKEQRQWSEQVRATDSSRAAAGERELAGRTDSLAASLQKLAPQVPGEPRQQALAEAAKRAKQAAAQMQQASKSAQQGRKAAAQQQGEQAADQLQPLGDQLQDQRQQMQQEWRQEVTDALDRALAETSRLSERQLRITRGFERGAPPAALRADQAAVEEGVARLEQQLKQAAGKNALVSPQIAQALAGAQAELQRSRDAVSSANPNLREAAERAGAGVDALNAAAYAMLRARENVSGSQSGSGLAEALERMQGLANQQGQLAQQSGGLLPMAGAAGMQQQLQQLGARQRALAEEMEKLKGQGNMPGAGEMADEAKDLARRIEAQRLDRDVVRRQERLFRRMLDAGRTLQGQEEDEQKERQSTTAKDDSVHLPPALRAKLLDEDQRIRVPTWDELQRLTPEERRLVMDYFRRLSEGANR
jgi:hypothetical protein